MRGFIEKVLFNRLKNKKTGDAAITPDLDIIVNSGESILTVLSADGVVSGTPNGAIRVGEYLIQFGRITTSDTTFVITYPIPLTNNPIYNSVQGASNDGGFVNAEIDAQTLPTTTQMTVHAETPTGGEYYYWMVIGRSAE